jgi:hypothetical protein
MNLGAAPPSASLQKSGEVEVQINPAPHRTMPKIARFVRYFRAIFWLAPVAACKLWRPRRDSNPRYRRERAKQAFCGGWWMLVEVGIRPVFMQFTHHPTLWRLVGVGGRLQGDMFPICSRVRLKIGKRRRSSRRLSPAIAGLSSPATARAARFPVSQRALADCLNRKPETPPKVVKPRLGNLILLAHNAGGSSSPQRLDRFALVFF